MRREIRSSVRILWSESNPQFSRAIDSLFADEGFVTRHHAANCDEIERVLRQSAPDLLIIDVMTDGGEAFELMRDIRNGRLSDDPFLTIIATSWDAQQPVIDHIYDCGADDAFIKPAPARKLTERIFTLAQDKRQFVVTANYIGPDRRREGNRTQQEESIRLPVPSTLRARAEGRTADGPMIEAQRSATIAQINEQRLQRGSLAISNAVNIFLPVCVAGRSDLDAIQAMGDAIQIAGDLRERATAGGYGHMLELCDAFIRICGEMRRIARSPNPGGQDPKNLKLVKSLGDALTIGFNPRHTNSDIAGEIGQQVSRYQSTRPPPRTGY